MQDMTGLQVIAMTKTTESPFYTVSEAARLLEVSPVTIWRWIESGRLPAYRLGPKNIRIRKEDLESMIKPARAKEVTMNKEGAEIKPATEEELARRKSVVSQILAKRRERIIAPLTTTDLVRKVREDERKSYAH